MNNMEKINLDFINKEISFDKIIKNEGIYETSPIGNTDISIGVSYEGVNDEEDVYIYNVFAKEEYINIGNRGDNNDKTPVLVIDEIRTVLSKLIQDFYINSRII